MITKTDQSLSDVFDVTPVGQQVAVQATPPAVIEKPVNIEPVDKDLMDDFQIARTMIQGLLVRGADAMENAILIANGTEDPKSFEAVTNLIGKLTDASEKLVGLHEKKNKSATKVAAQPEMPQGGNINMTGPVFVGSTSELAKMINDSRKNNQGDS